MVPLGAKSGPKVSQSGAPREVWEHISKKTAQMWFWRDSGIHFGGQNAPKRDSGLHFGGQNAPKMTKKLPRREAKGLKIMPLGAKSGAKVDRSGGQREVWKHTLKKTPKKWFRRNPWLHFGRQKAPKKSPTPHQKIYQKTTLEKDVSRLHL